MPTKKKRVGFIPREHVMKIIEKLSIENNLSNSKIINILVEEALSIRGIFDKKTGKTTKSYQQIKDNSQDLYEDTSNFRDNNKFKVNTKSRNNENSYKTSLLTQKYHEGFDLETYNKFISFLKFQEMMDKFND